MKIGIDYSLATATHRGMGRYVREIVKCLMQSDFQNQYILYTYQPLREKLPPNFRERRMPTSNPIIAEQWYLPQMAKVDKLDVLWCPGNTFPLLLHRGIKLVVTIHDLIFMKSSQGNTLRQKIGRIYRKWVLYLGKKRINICLSVSQFSADEIRQILGIMDVTITYNCVDAFYALVQSMKSIPRDGDFYFTVSGDSPSKNLTLLIDTFQEFLPNEKLIIAGVSKSATMRNRQTPKIQFLPQGIDDKELVVYYSQCKAFVFVSLSEGFGIPLLEALVCDAPIICSNTTSIPEVVGDFGIKINPTDKYAIAKAIQEIAYFKEDKNKKNEHLQKFLQWNNSAYIIKQKLTS